MRNTKTNGINEICKCREYLKGILFSLRLCDHLGDVYEVMDKIMRDLGYSEEEISDFIEENSWLDIDKTIWEVELNSDCKGGEKL